MASRSSSSMSTPQLLQRHHELQLQGPRPVPLKVMSSTTADDDLQVVVNANKFKKRRLRPHHQAPRQPVIIYVESPKVVHAHPGEFKSVVQRLTGAPPPSSTVLFSASAAPPPLQQFPFQFPLVGLGLQGGRTLTTTAADGPPASSCPQLPTGHGYGHEHDGPAGGGSTSLGLMMISPGALLFGLDESRQSMTTVTANHHLLAMNGL